MIKSETIYQGICDKCGAKLTEKWNNYDVVADTLRQQQRIAGVDGQINITVLDAGRRLIMKLIDLLEVIENDEPFQLLDFNGNIITEPITLDGGSQEDLQKLIGFRSSNVRCIRKGNKQSCCLKILLDFF